MRGRLLILEERERDRGRGRREVNESVMGQGGKGLFNHHKEKKCPLLLSLEEKGSDGGDGVADNITCAIFHMWFIIIICCICCCWFIPPGHIIPCVICSCGRLPAFIRPPSLPSPTPSLPAAPPLSLLRFSVEFQWFLTELSVLEGRRHSSGKVGLHYHHEVRWRARCRALLRRGNVRGDVFLVFFSPSR